MLILVGLGNPGKKYASTRHNAGKMLAAYLRHHPVEGLAVLETDCFMNQSGEWIKNKMAEMAEMVKNHENSNHSSHSNRFNHLFIAHDDLDLPLGSFKVHFGRGPRLHQGILSIEQALGTKNFWRVRIGVDNRQSLVGGEARIGKRQASGVAADSRQPPDETSLATATDYRPAGEEYVLRPFRREEKTILIRTFNSIRLALVDHVTKSVRSDVDSDSIASDSIATEEI